MHDHLKTATAKILLSAMIAGFGLANFTTAAYPGTALAQAKIIIEHDVTENNTGYQAFVEGEGWQKLEIIGPNGVVTEIQSLGPLNDMGLTEVLMETPEMEASAMPLEEVLKTMPEGSYEFRTVASKLAEGKGEMIGKAELTHKIPAGVTLIEPKPDATVASGDVTLRWSGSDKALDGSSIHIIGYQLVVDKAEKPHPNMIAKKGLVMFLEPLVTKIAIPAAFFEPGMPYAWEVFAIEESGNQTLTSSTFKTQ